MMNLSIQEIEGVEPLGRPKPIRFGKREYRAMSYFAELNHNVSIAHVARVFAEIGIKLTKQNDGMLPLVDQVRLARTMGVARKRSAKRRARR